jgi:hypothetical protein
MTVCKLGCTSYEPKTKIELIDHSGRSFTMQWRDFLPERKFTLCPSSFIRVFHKNEEDKVDSVRFVCESIMRE